MEPSPVSRKSDGAPTTDISGHPLTPEKERQYRESLIRLEKYANWLDSQYQIPGTGIRFGWDAIMGFIPVIGDLAGLACSGFIIMEARRIGAPKALMARMVRNVAVEFVGGAAPIVGDAFDIYWKSNMRNVELLRGYIQKQLIPPEEKRPIPWVWLSLTILVFVILLLYTISTPDPFG